MKSATTGIRMRQQHPDAKTPVKRKVNQPVLRVLLQQQKHIISGYGACSVSGCHCQNYMGSDQTCTNCGHNYSMHW